jgi:hypothetical protein
VVSGDGGVRQEPGQLIVFFGYGFEFFEHDENLSVLKSIQR